MNNKDLLAAVQSKVRAAVIQASTVFSEDKKEALRNAINHEDNPNAKWVLEQTLENALIAEQNKTPLCDDTGVPHVFLELGGASSLTGEMLQAIHLGVAAGLRDLPGRPMAVRGDDVQRLEQSVGLDEASEALALTPIIVKTVEEDILRLHLLMQGGGPEIRGKTYRVFHKHSISVIMDEIIKWATESASLLGCTPCIPAIGIGRSHYEAAALMLEAMAYGDLRVQNDIERQITDRLNAQRIGPLGLGGSTTALGTFLRVGPQRASGIRIVCLRLCCSVEPRRASVSLLPCAKIPEI